MHAEAGFLRDLAVVLCVAAVIGVLFGRLRMPTVLGYLLAGVIVGPHLGTPLVANQETIRELAELGVIVLLFSIGLEFSVRRLLRLGPSAGVIATVEVGWMIWLGYLAAQMLGWGARTGVFAGAMVAISSTMIVARSLERRTVDRKLSDLVFGILVVEDLFAILVIAALSTLGSGEGLATGDLILASLRLGLFLVTLVAAGLFIVPRALSYVARFQSRETTLLASIGLCFAFALLAEAFGYSAALGAFIAGILASESGQAHRIELLIRPVRDIFGAVFFVSVGMLVDPLILAEHWLSVVVFTVVVVVGKISGITVGALLVGIRTQLAVRAGFSLAQIGEFSFLIAATAVALGPSGDHLAPVAVAVCVVTAFLTPWLTRHGEAAGRLAAQHAPGKLRTFLSLYATWLESVRLRTPNDSFAARLRRTGARMLVDAGMMVALVIAAGLSEPRITPLLQEWTGVSTRIAHWSVLAVTLLALTPFVMGVLRCARQLGQLIAEQVLPAQDGGLDLADAPRRALVAGVQLALLLMVGLPAVALMQPFLPLLPGVGVLLALVLLAFVGLWRSAGNLQGHVSAGTGVILEVLARQARADHEPTLDSVQVLLPGLGTPTAVQLGGRFGAVGHSVGAVNLHGRSGAVLLCISRSDESVVTPDSKQVYQAGDVLTLAGTAEAVALARQVLEQGPQP